MDEQGVEFKAVVTNGLKLGASLAMAEHIPWLLWMFPFERGSNGFVGRNNQSTNGTVTEAGDHKMDTLVGRKETEGDDTARLANNGDEVSKSEKEEEDAKEKPHDKKEWRRKGNGGLLRAQTSGGMVGSDQG